MGDFGTPARLVDSALWRLSSDFYRREGLSAWRHGTVPWRVTNSVAMARLYAQVIDAFADELGVPTVRVLELGGGTGRLAYYLSQELSLRGRLEHYALTEASSSTVEGWRRHPQLMALVQQGVLGLSTLDALADSRALAAAVRPHGAAVPTVVIANYVLDSLPHSAWRVDGGELYEGWVELKEGDSTQLDWELTFRVARAPAPFVRGYGAAVGQGMFLLPEGAFGVLRALRGAAALLLVADKGYATRDEVRRAGDVRLARHHSVSAMVNFDALQAFCGWQGVLWPRQHDPDLKVLAVPFVRRALALPKTARALEHAAYELNPVAAVRAVDQALTQPNDFAGLMTALSAARFDPDALVRLAAPLRGVAARLGADEGRVLVGALTKVSANVFDVSDPFDVDFEIGTVLQRMGQLSLAAHSYRRSVERRGKQVPTLFNLALCALDLGARPQGLELLRAVLEREPDHVRAAELLAVLEREPT